MLRPIPWTAGIVGNRDVVCDYTRKSDADTHRRNSSGKGVVCGLKHLLSLATALYPILEGAKVKDVLVSHVFQDLAAKG